MKKSNLAKISLTILALVGAFAISARANGPSDLIMSASQARGPANAQHPKTPLHALLPAAIYSLDDGTAENSIGLTLGGDVIALNEFAVMPGSETINSISIAWGTPLFPDPSLNGLPYTAVLWSDPNGDGQPGDAVVLATADGVISAEGTDTFLTTPITPTTVTTPNFFVGFLVGHGEGQFPAAFDEARPTLSDRSFIAGDSVQADINDLNNNELPVAPIESFGLIGNWLIRADGSGGGGGDLTLDRAVSGGRAKGGFKVHLPLTGTPAVEDRTGGGNGNYNILMLFNNNITSIGNATTSCGGVRSVSISGTDAHRVNIHLIGVLRPCNASDITVTLTGVEDDQGNTLPSASVTFGLLIGDVNGDGTVNRSDLTEATSHQGEKTDRMNFRSDVNADGTIDFADGRIIREQFGTSLP